LGRRYSKEESVPSTRTQITETTNHSPKHTQLKAQDKQAAQYSWPLFFFSKSQHTAATRTVLAASLV
jgi:hypothetical protein